MTEIGFYHMTRSSLEQTLPKLLEKVLEQGKRALVLAGSPERVEALNGLLWTYHPDSFLPHGSVRDGKPELQPIWLSDRDENANKAEMLFLTDGATSAHVASFARCFELFDGGDDDAVAAARERWKHYKEQGHSLTYWQQNERGGWEKKQ